MRRISKALAASILGFTLGAVLLICSVPNVGEHLKVSGQSQSAVSCDTSCHSHSQHVFQSPISQVKDEDDKEPTPPPFAWLSIATNLSLLYLPLLAATLWFGYRQQQTLLTTHLRY